MSNIQSPQAFENLSDRNLTTLNQLLPWSCYTEDSMGRKLGRHAWQGKRSHPQEIPDERIRRFNDLVPLEGRTVLELGCFEGVHTIGLCAFTPHVIGIDARIENVAKTLIRCAAYGHFPRIFPFDLEDLEATAQLPEFDALHHVGVLYHLSSPLGHLNAILPRIKKAVLLDTHYATDQTATFQDQDGMRYQLYKEFGQDEVFSGMRPYSKWMLKSDLFEVLEANGFGTITILKDEVQRHGPRITLAAIR